MLLMAIQSHERAPKRPRGRPSAANSVDPADILEAAIDAVSRGGYDALSMRGVARSMGVSLATVQHHFGTKADLYRSMVDHVFATFDELRSRVPESDLLQRIRNGLDASSVRPGLLAALLADRAPGHEERLAHFAQRFRELMGEPAAMVADFRDGQPGRAVDPDAFMMLILGFVTMAGTPDTLRIIYGIDVSSARDRRRLADGVADLLGHGLLGTPVERRG